MTGTRPVITGVGVFRMMGVRAGDRDGATVARRSAHDPAVLGS